MTERSPRPPRATEQEGDELERQREQAVEALTRHYTNSVVGLAEFERRVSLAERASRSDQLDALVVDLEPRATPPPAAMVPAYRGEIASPGAEGSSKTMVAVLSGTVRRGRWKVPRQLKCVAVLGAFELDFRDAVLEPGVTELTVVAVLGGASIRIPPWLPVEVDGFGVLGGWDDRSTMVPEEAATGTPVLRIKGVAILGGVEIDDRLPGESAKQARRRRRQQHRGHYPALPAAAPRLGVGVPAGGAATLPSAAAGDGDGAAASPQEPSGLESAPTMLQVPLAATLPVGSVFADRYTMRTLLGRGGMGTVYLATDRQLDADVAIKIANIELATNAVLLDRLRREVAAAQRITHENVIRVHDLGECAGRLYISMEYFAAHPLSTLVLRDGPMAGADVRRIGAQVGKALRAAHGAGVIHRDLKPQNILQNDEGHVKVIDFGLAFAPHLEGLTSTGLVMGTPEYMAPEQIRGEQADERCDLYAMGCVLYHLLVGQPPFVADNPIAIGIAHLQNEPTPPSEACPGVASQWDELCGRLLAKDPADRLSTADQLCAELDALA